jgi:hypothetical protein
MTVQLNDLIRLEAKGDDIVVPREDIERTIQALLAKRRQCHEQAEVLLRQAQIAYEQTKQLQTLLGQPAEQEQAEDEATLAT